MPLCTYVDWWFYILEGDDHKYKYHQQVEAVSVASSYQRWGCGVSRSVWVVTCKKAKYSMFCTLQSFNNSGIELQKCLKLVIQHEYNIKYIYFILFKRLMVIYPHQSFPPIEKP